MGLIFYSFCVKVAIQIKTNSGRPVVVGYVFLFKELGGRMESLIFYAVFFMVVTVLFCILFLLMTVVIGNFVREIRWDKEIKREWDDLGLGIKREGLGWPARVFIALYLLAGFGVSNRYWIIDQLLWYRIESIDTQWHECNIASAKAPVGLYDLRMDSLLALSNQLEQKRRRIAAEAALSSLEKQQALMINAGFWPEETPESRAIGDSIRVMIKTGGH